MKAFVVFLISVCTGIAANAQSGITEVNLQLLDLAYDPVAQRLFATSANDPTNLLQLDPVTGAVTATYPVGNTPSRLVLDGNRGLWIGLNGDGSVRRFNLDTLTPGLAINVIPAGSTAILDMAPSPNDTDTLAVTAGRTYLVRDGTLQADSVPSLRKIVMVGNYVFGTSRARMTPTGLIVDGPGVSGDGTSELQLLNGLIYRMGSAVDPLIPWQSVVNYSFPLQETDPFRADPFDVAFAVNPEDNSYLMLTSYHNQFHLTRYDRTSAALTGYARFTAVPGNWTIQMTATGTNRVAVSIYNKLFLLDLSSVFVPGDLQVSAVATPSPALFAQLVTETITLTNHGPGYVIHASVTNRVSGSARFSETPPGYPYILGAPWQLSEVHWDFQILAPGESISVQATVVATNSESFTNAISVDVLLDSNLQNNFVELPVTVRNQLADSVARIGIGGSGTTRLAYDGVTDQLFIGDTIGNVFALQLTEATFQTPPFTFPFGYQYPIEYLSVSEKTRTAWVVGRGGWAYFYTIPLDAGAPSPLRVLHGNTTLRDFKASPVASNLAAYSDSSAVRLWGSPGDSFVVSAVAGAGAIQFSPDGSKVYETLDFDCSLRVLNVTATNLIVAATYPNIGCYEFAASSNLLYFNNGLVFDPAAGLSVTNLNLPYPSWMLLDPAGPLNVLTRSQTSWEVRRLHRDTLAPISTIYLGPSYTPTEAIQAGTNRIAFRNASGEAVLVRLDSQAPPALFALRAGINAAGQFTLSFVPPSPGDYSIFSAERITDSWQPTALLTNVSSLTTCTWTNLTPTESARYYIVRKN